MAEYTLEEIRDYWRTQAATHGSAYAASWSDEWAIDLEVREILKWVDDGHRVLDVGCANGYSTVQYASQRTIDIRGLDVTPEMIQEATVRAAAFSAQSNSTIEFAAGDICCLEESDAQYDRVIVTRVVINLGDWARQRTALQECARVVRPGGLLLLSEATVQGWRRMNEFRAEWMLAEIPVPPFNQYLDEDAVVEALTPKMELVSISNFASTYYVGTRILKPLLAKACAPEVDTAKANMQWNEWFSKLPTAGDYGTQKLFVFAHV